MGKTTRRCLGWSRRVTDKFGWSGVKQLITVRDGKNFANDISGSAKEGKLNKWDDVGPGYGKRTANRQIRLYHQRQCVSRVAEHLEDQRIIAEEIEEQEREDAAYYAMLEKNYPAWDDENDRYPVDNYGDDYDSIIDSNLQAAFDDFYENMFGED